MSSRHLIPNFYQDIKDCIIGVDEVGRGALCGPVVSCAILLNENIIHYELSKEIDDSKKISEKKRKLLSKFIEKNSTFSIGLASNIEIDKINILNATVLSMRRALNYFRNFNNEIRIDGQRIFNFNDKTFFVNKGDQNCVVIAAASIVAKCFRDNFMLKLSKSQPNYMWDKNKGYGTKEHFERIKQFGITSHHRKTFLKKKIKLKT